MKKLGTTVFVLLITLLLVTPTQKPLHEEKKNIPALNQDKFPQHIPSSITDTGKDRNGTMFMSRTIADLNTSILNTYANPDAHNGSIDFSQYHIPGWTLYKTDVIPQKMEGAPEKELAGVSSNPAENFRIEEHDPGLYYNQLAQGFNLTQDGRLVNYSLYCYMETAGRQISAYGNLYLMVREQYNDSATNVTNYDEMDTISLREWYSVTTSSILDGGHEYHVVMDGSSLSNIGQDYPTIYWLCETEERTYTTYRYDTASTDGWSVNLPYEGLLNYTYVPWNVTSNSVLEFSASKISLQGNGSSLSGETWTFKANNNLSSISFSSNQSVYMNHNLTLWYKRDSELATRWEVDSSGSLSNWNLTTSLGYPEYGDTTGKYVNMSKMSDWTPSALYNGSSEINHDNFTAYVDTVTCSNMTNGTWTLTLTAPNYIDTIDTFDSADNSVLPREASIVVDMDINTTVSGGSGDSVNSGFTNLTVLHEGAKTWTPDNQSVVDGKTHYLWNINETTQDNGTYTLEIYWTNGTEAGYRTKEIVVFYSTSLEADRYSIDAYTESSFSIRVQFNDTYNDIGLNGSSATAMYSFDGESNQTMTDQNNGTWTANISTAGRSPGSHTIEVFGEGFAIENQSLAISVELLHDTEPLTVDWSNGNDITYLEQTTLLVNYSLFNGTSVPDATVNVTIDSDTWDLVWNGTSELYELTFNGADDPPGLGTHSLTFSAWKSGYEAQTDTGHTIILREEPTFLELGWYQSNSITYTQNTTLRANYTISNGSSVENAQINVTIGSDTWNLTWNETSGFYELVFNGSDSETGLGTFSLTVQASRTNYESKSASPSDLTISEEPTSIQVTWQPTNVTIDTTQLLNLTVDYTYGEGDVPDDATINVTIDANVYNLTYNSTHWVVSIPGQDFPADVYNASIVAWRYGYASETHETQDINITLTENAFRVFWEPSDQNISYIETISLNVTYAHEGEPITDATVRLILNGTRSYDLTYTASIEKWKLTLPGDEILLGTWNATVIANKTGYFTGREVSYVTVYEDNPAVSPSWITNSTDYITTIDLYVDFRSSEGTPITDGTVQVTVHSETYVGQHVSQGNYSVTIGPELPIENNSMTLYVNRYGYSSQEINLYLNVIEASTTLTVNHTGLEIYYDGMVNITIEYSMHNTSIIHPANLSFLVNSETHSASWTGTYWETTLNATLLEVAIHECVVNVSAYGFVSKEETFQVQVSSIPTALEIEGRTWLYVNDSVILDVEYLDTRTSSRIEDPSPTIAWAGPYDIVQNADLTYSLTIQSINLHANNYTLEITFAAEGHDSALESPSIEVRRLPLSLIFAQDMEIYENETMQVTVLVNETYHAQLIDFAQVNLTIDESTYTLNYDEASESYTVSIWLNSSIEPSDYTIGLRASAIDCQTAEDELSLQVLPKAEYTLEAELVSQTTVVTEGSALALRAVLENSNGNPLPGKTIIFYVRMSGSNGETVENTTAVTNENGIANAGFDIPPETTGIEVWARYAGSISEWPVESEVLVVEVRPAPSLIEVLINTVRTPQAQLIILLALIAVVGALVYTKVIKPRKEASAKSMQRQLNLFRELSTLQHFMAIYIEHGTCVIYFPFTEKYIEPDLISGFISAITSVYSEITGEGGVKGTLEEIHYHGLRLNSYSGRYIIGILILESEMSSILKRRLEFFVDMFESQYESDLEDWMGRVECFDPEWVLSNLISTLDYYWLLPQRIADEKRIQKENKTLLEFIQSHLDEREEFHIDEILTPLSERLGEPEAETLEKLLTLQEEGAIEPISVQSLITRRNLGLSGVEGQAIEPIGEDDIIEPEQEEMESKTEVMKSESEIEQPMDKEEVVEITGNLQEDHPESKEQPTKETKQVQEELDKTPEEEGTEPEDKTYAFLKEVERHLLEEKKEKEQESTQDE